MVWVHSALLFLTVVLVTSSNTSREYSAKARLKRNSTRARFLTSHWIGETPRCPAGYIDHTAGRAYWWECGKGCPGVDADPWADFCCGCACVPPSACLGNTSADKCVTYKEATVGLCPDTKPEPVPRPTPSPLMTAKVPPTPPPVAPTPAPVGSPIRSDRPFAVRTDTTAAPTQSSGGLSTLAIVLLFVAGFCLCCICLSIPVICMPAKDEENADGSMKIRLDRVATGSWALVGSISLTGIRSMGLGRARKGAQAATASPQTAPSNKSLTAPNQRPISPSPSIVSVGSGQGQSNPPPLPLAAVQQQSTDGLQAKATKSQKSNLSVSTGSTGGGQAATSQLSQGSLASSAHRTADSQGARSPSQSPRGRQPENKVMTPRSSCSSNRSRSPNASPRDILGNVSAKDTAYVAYLKSTLHANGSPATPQPDSNSAGADPTSSPVVTELRSAAHHGTSPRASPNVTPRSNRSDRRPRSAGPPNVTLPGQAGHPT